MKYFFIICELCILLTGLYMLSQDSGDKWFFATAGWLIGWGIDKLSDSIKEEYLITLENKEKM